MLVIFAKAVMVLSELIRIAKHVIQIVTEIKESKARITAAMATKVSEKNVVGSTNTLKAHSWDISKYPECEESDYPSSMFFGIPESEHI